MSTFFGSISSSCSYAAASMARTLLLKGATWSNAVAFMVSSTNLVFEIFIIIVTLLGWSFFGGEVAGGILFIVISAMLVRWLFSPKVKQNAIHHSHAGEAHGGHEHHHDHSAMAGKSTSFSGKLKTAAGCFYMDVKYDL